MPKERKMTPKRRLLYGCLLATVACSIAQAQTRTVRLNTTQAQVSKWTVYEVSGGQVESAPAVYDGTGIWGHFPSITIPFTNCDGYWRARRLFHVPVGATNIVLKITGLAVDDRAVIVLNGVRITSVGTTRNGAGEMQFHDPGGNGKYNFQFKAGHVTFTDTVDARPGRNDLKVIVNNTNDGIYGKIQPITPNSPSGFGINATVSYTP
jgi:hypothetical protein